MDARCAVRGARCTVCGASCAVGPSLGVRSCFVHRVSPRFTVFHRVFFGSDLAAVPRYLREAGCGSGGGLGHLTAAVRWSLGLPWIDLGASPDRSGVDPGSIGFALCCILEVLWSSSGPCIFVHFSALFANWWGRIGLPVFPGFPRTSPVFC